ncbi:MAG TPA: hypothetical protein VFJ65_09085 [Solirubrobacterales bacterium]|nr:hypothetical protein [Solirubrobacterales bacterium]
MSRNDDSLPIAVVTAQNRDLKPLAEECTEALKLDSQQLATMESFLHEAWFFGIRTGHRMMIETKMGQEGDPLEVVIGMQSEFQDLMEDLGEALNATVGATIDAWKYLGQAWIAGAKFWEVEIAARLIEREDGGFDQLPWLED